MSNTEETNSSKVAEKDNKVVISPEDCAAALDFWRHFNIPVPANLQSAFDDFSKEPTFANQQRVKLYICKAISETEHEAFKDDMFSKIVDECQAVSFDMEFDKDLEDTVTVENK